MRTLRIPVDGANLGVLRFGDGPNVVLAAHGITGSGMSFTAVADRMPPEWTLLAPDLRGRGASSAEPGPGGLAGHARDLVAVIDHLGGTPVVLAGHSMGAYVALLTAAARPDLVSRLVLVDGALPLPVPADADLDAVLAASLGPALARLSRTFPTEQAYVDFFREHPALGPHWNPDIETYVRYDAALVDAAAGLDAVSAGPSDGMPGAVSGRAGVVVRSKAQEPVVRVDGRDLLGSVDTFGAALRSLTVPTLLLTAPGGMFGAPPGFIPEPLVRQWCAEAPALRAELVADTNHYTIILAPAAAALVARRLTDPATWPA